MFTTRLLTVSLLLLALFPSAHFAWTSRDMPHFGHFHDDSLNLVNAKSIAEGTGYRIISHPAQPFQTKYPPLYAYLLSIVWRLAPAFPANLVWATLFAWITLPILLVAGWLFYRSIGFSATESVILWAVLACCPWIVFHGTRLLGDVLFTGVLLLAFAIAERSGKAWVAALWGAVALLIRTAALPLIISMPLCILFATGINGWRQRVRSASISAAILFTPAAAWMLWSSMHRDPAATTNQLYYTDYTGFFLRQVSIRDLPAILWKNLDQMMSSIGNLFVFGLSEGFFGYYAALFLAIAAIAGTVRLARERKTLHYPVFAVLYTGLLLIWNFAPTEELMLPLYPLLLAGLFVEMRHLASLIRAAIFRGSVTGNRIVALVAVVLIALFTALAVAKDYTAIATYLPQFVDGDRQLLTSRRSLFERIQRETPADATFLAYLDPVLYLYTGRRACRLFPNTTAMYRQDLEGVLADFRSIDTIARREGVLYLLMTPADYNSDFPVTVQEKVRNLIGASPGLRQVFSTEAGSLLAIK
jgi:hypothetical protein